MTESDKLRDLPSVDEILSRIGSDLPYPRALIVDEIRRVLDEARQTIRTGNDAPAIEPCVRERLAALARPSLRPVINATGVVLHTNLGRAPVDASAAIAGYSNLEYDLTKGRRGKRDVHIAGLLERLLGAPGIAVNNNGAAIFLALHELAAGAEVIVSRGELIEIGDGFRIPDIMQRSGALLREVGTTNRTRIDDYRAAITDRTKLLLRVHPSNFHMSGFTSRPELRELAALGRDKGIAVYEDLGSGCVTDLSAFGIREPLAADSLRQGADLVSFSGDKLLGGPQAGILAGKPELIERLRRNPMFRALRLDKIIYQILENTLRDLLLERYDCIPALRMIRQSSEAVRERAARVAGELGAGRASLIEGSSVIGGGATPAQSIPTCLIALETTDAVKLERRLRAADPAVIARIAEGRVLLDLRTVFPGEEDALIKAVTAAF
ncbi:MAG: L-seryl-tRNA(Sec) selenium transferase [Bryobacteraceae bacterium]